MTGSLRLVAGGGGLPFARGDVAPRLRPGDRPVVVHAPLTPSQLRRLRHRAHSHGLGADALVALAVEWRFLMDLVGEKFLERADTHARRPAASLSLAAAEFQSWQRVLMGFVPPPPDDLPEIHLPLRLAATLAPDEREDAVLAALALPEQVVDQAVALELAATRHGLTMQTWVLALAVPA